MKSVSSALREWFIIAFGDVMKLIRDGNRTDKELEQLRAAVQATISGQSFKMVLTETIEGLCLSLDPAKIQQGWQQLYDKWWDKRGLRPLIPEVPYDAKQIQREKKRGRVLIFVWDQLAAASALPTLGELFPKMSSWSTNADGDIVVEPVLSGWMFVESTLDAPNRNTTESKLREVFTKQNTQGMTLNMYIILGQFCGEVFGSYPDINTCSRLLGSSYSGDVLNASFDSDGSLRVYHYLYPGSAGGIVGGRSAAV